MKHGLGLEKPALWAVRRPMFATFILVVFFCTAGWLLPQLRFDDDINRVLLSDNTNSKNYEQQVKASGGKSFDVAIYFERSDAFTKSDYEGMRSFALDLEFIEGIANTISPFSARFPKTAKSNAGQPVLPEILHPPAIEQRLQSFADSETGFGALISTNRDSALFLATTKAGLPRETVTKLLDEITKATAVFSSTGLSATVTGEATVSKTITEGLKLDLVKLNVLGALLVMCFSLMIFKDWRSTLLAVLPALVAVFACLSIFVLLDYPITVISNVLPLLVLILGVADGMHLVIHLRNQPEGQPGAQPLRLETTLREIAPACALSAVTTAIAFLTVAISDNPQIREFAVAGALSVMTGYFAVVVTFALLAALLKPGPSHTSSEPSSLTAILVATAKLPLRKDRQITVVAVCLMLLGGWGYSTTQNWFPYEGNLPSTSNLQSISKQITDEFGGTYRLWSELDTSGTNGLETEAGWKRLTELTDAIKTAAPDYPTISMVSVARWLGKPERLPNASEISDVPDTLRSQLMVPSESVARVLTFVPEPMQSQQTLKTHDRLETAALEAGSYRVTGLPQIMRHEAINIVRQLGLGLLLACGLSALLVGLAFRNLRLAVVLLIPNVLPLLLTASALHVIGGGLMTPTAVLALTIAFGIAINDSVHCINRLYYERKDGREVDDALKNTIKLTGRVMILTTVLLSVGLLVTQFSVFAPVQLFGQMLIITFVIALFADLIILPALIKQKWSAV